MTKDKNSTTWYADRWGSCEEHNFTLSGQVYSERQCGVLNMSVSSYTDTSDIVYAVSCDERRLGFVCQVPKGELPEGRKIC
jgi:hypothetical protein